MSVPLAAALPAPPAAALLTPRLVAVFAAACGLAVANLYYAQPLIGPIAASLALPAALAGLVMTLVQLGYGAGLLLVVPLADAVENRRLVVSALAAAALGLVGIAASTSAAAFLAAAFLVGVCAVATQVLVPFASLLAPEASRGKVVGSVMAGLLAGIMLARPFAGAVAAAFGWRAVFGLSALVMAALAAALWRLLPERRPLPAGDGASVGLRHRYARTLASLPGLVRATPLLRRRAFYQGMMFAGFSAFWTGVPLLLAHAFGFDQRGIALFALAGAAGALAAPWAGRLADRGLTRPATGAALAVALAAFVLAGWAAARQSLAGLTAAALLLDAAVQVCQVLSLRSLYMLAPELRGRLNGLFMAFVFLCGATASGLAAAACALYGWTALAALGGGCAAAALALYAGERRVAVRAA